MKLILALLTGIGLSAFADGEVSTLPKLKMSDPLPAGLFIDLAKAVNPAVVNISTTYLPHGRANIPRDPLFEMFEPLLGPQYNQPVAPQQALGTGFIIRDDGLIVTNNHVIDKADVIKVQIDERTKVRYDAKLIGKDPRTDIALIKIDAKRKLPFVRMGASSEVQVGEWVGAFGNPYGYGHTMTKGIISALGRELEDLNLNPFMQTDASINPGNSGGPLVNTQGLVIGVNTAVDARAQGIGFVIPIDSVKSILPALEKEGRIKRGFLGVMLSDVDEDSAQSINPDQSEGALVADVGRGSPAEKAGIKPWDLITEFNGKKIANSHDLTRAVILTPIDSSVPVKLLRNGKAMTLKATVAAPSEILMAANTIGAGRGRGKAPKGLQAPYDLGFAIADISGALREEFKLPDLPEPRPVLILVEPGSPAARAGLSPGDVVLDINRRETVHARDVLANLKRHTINILRVLKTDRTVFIPLRTN